MRIVNLNTWVGCLPRGVFGEVVTLEPPGHKRRRFEVLLAELRERDPDFVTFQECLPLPSFAEDMAKALDYDVFWRVANGGLRFMGRGFPSGVGLGEGMAILAKKAHGMRPLGAKKLSGAGFVANWMSFQLGPCRYALAARASVDGRPVIIVNTHVRYGFPSREAFQAAWIEMHRRGVTKEPTPPRWVHDLTHSNGEARDKEIRRLAKWLLELRSQNQGAPVLVGADFNIDPDTPQMAEFLASTGYRNVLPERHPGVLTWDPRDNANIAYGIDFKWPDGSDKSTILQMIAYLDSIPQCPDHVLLSPGLELVDCGRAFDVARDGTFASDHFGIWADARPQA
ncbi:MAG: endonuclease/exonuclease/phosphatase family protein [Myxococcota bacterium]